MKSRRDNVDNIMMDRCYSNVVQISNFEPHPALPAGSPCCWPLCAQQLLVISKSPPMMCLKNCPHRGTPQPLPFIPWVADPVAKPDQQHNIRPPIPILNSVCISRNANPTKETNKPSGWYGRQHALVINSASQSNLGRNKLQNATVCIAMLIKQTRQDKTNENKLRRESGRKERNHHHFNHPPQPTPNPTHRNHQPTTITHPTITPPHPCFLSIHPPAIPHPSCMQAKPPRPRHTLNRTTKQCETQPACFSPACRWLSHA